jgi:hypothetical protein
MSACTSSATEARLAATLLLGLALAPAAPAAAPTAGPTDLRELLGKGEKALGRAEDAAHGKDAGRVSLLLQRAGALLDEFRAATRLQDLQAALEEARARTGSGDLPGAAAAVRRARGLLPALADYVVTREAEVAYRAALGAAEEGDAALCRQAIERLEGAILAPVLLARLDEARKGIERARAAMVRRDMAAGRTEIAAARRALEGLHYCGALSRAQFALRIGSELLRDGTSLAARDQVQKASRDLRLAASLAPEPRREALEQARERLLEVWRRINRPQTGDAKRLEELGHQVESIRSALQG